MLSSVSVSVDVAGDHVDAGLLWQGLTSYAALRDYVLRYYDGVGDGPPVPLARIDVAALGRVLFLERSFTAEEAVLLLETDLDELLAEVPPGATLADADPEIDDGLFDAAERVHRALVDGTARTGSTVVSAALALVRPGLFPLLNGPTRMLYRDVAGRAWETSTKPRRPFSRRTYWPVIRDDVLAATDTIAEWRAKLGASEVEAERWLSRVTDVRLWGAATTVLAAGAAPGGR